MDDPNPPVTPDPEGEEIELPLDLPALPSKPEPTPPAEPAPEPPAPLEPISQPTAEPETAEAVSTPVTVEKKTSASAPAAAEKPKARRVKSRAKKKKAVPKKTKPAKRAVSVETPEPPPPGESRPENPKPKPGKAKRSGSPATPTRKRMAPPTVPTPSPAAHYPFVRFRRLALPLPGAEPQGLAPPRAATPEPSWPKNPKVSVVIYNHNGADRLWNFLFALKTQSYRAQEVILVDNRSTDMSVSFVRANHPEVRILELQERFPEPQAVNLGFMEAGGDLVAVVQTTLALPPDWLKRSVEAFQSRAADAGAVVCPVHGRAGWEPVEVFNVLGQVVGREAPYPGGEPFHPFPGAVLFRRRLFHEGLYDEELPSGPDPFVLGWRLRSQGYHLYWAFEAKVLRPAGPGLHARSSALRGDFDSERRRWAALFACTESSTFLKLAPLLLVDAVLRPFTRWFHPGGSFWGTAAGTVWAWCRKGAVSAPRDRNIERRRMSDREVARFISGKFTSHKGLLADLVNAIVSSYLAAVGFSLKSEATLSRPPASGRRL